MVYGDEPGGVSNCQGSSGVPVPELIGGCWQVSLVSLVSLG